MKRILLAAALAIGMFIGLTDSALAVCPATFAVMKDNAASTFNMGLVSDVNGNCQSFNSVNIPSAAVASGAFASGSIGAGAMVDITNVSTPLSAAAGTATKALAVGGQFLTTQPTMTNTQQASILFSTRGEVLVSPGVSGFNVTNAGTFAVQATQSGTWNIGTVATITNPVTVAQVTASSLNATVVGTGTFSVQLTGATNNINNISGTISLPTGAATSANQQTNAAAGSTTSGQTGGLEMAAVTTAAPTYTTGQTNYLSLNTAGGLRVDGSGITQPVSIAGAVTVAQATAASLNATVVGNGTFAVQAAQSGTWNVTNISGTVSLPTGASTAALQPTNAAQGSTTAGQTGNLMQAAVTTGSPAYTTAQTSPLSLTTAGALRVDASATTQPISGTVTAAQTTAANLNATVVGTGTFAVQATLQASAATAIGKVDPNTIGSWGLQVSTQNSATPTNGGLVLGQFNTAPTTITTGNVSPLQLDSGGNLKVNIITGASSGAVAQGSTTSGQTGGLIQAAALTAAPTYTTATTNPLTMDLSGALRVNVTTAVGLAQGSTTSGQTGSLIMGAVTTAAPTYTTAQTNAISLDTAGNIRVNCTTGCAAGTVSNASSAVATSATNSGTVAYNYGFNGTTWDQFQVDASKNLKVVVNAALPAGTNLMGKVGIDQTTPGTTNGTQDASTGSTGATTPTKAIQEGGTAQNAEATAVTTGQLKAIVTDLVGKQIVLPYANPENFLNGQITTAMTATTSTALTGMGAQGAGVRVYVTSCSFSNSHATVGTMILLQDGSAGTTLWQQPAAPAFGGGNITFPTPIKTTANNGLFAVNVTTGSNTFVSCTGYKGI